jgi:hypothetical protein
MALSTIQDTLDRAITLCSSLHEEADTLADRVDPSRIPTVMGSVSPDTSGSAPGDILLDIKSDQALTAVINNAAGVDLTALHKAVLEIVNMQLDKFGANRNALLHKELETAVMKPAHSAVRVIRKMVTDIRKTTKEAKFLAGRNTGSAANEAVGKANQETFVINLDIVIKAVIKIQGFWRRIKAEASKISAVLEDESADTSGLAAMQDRRAALEKETGYIEKGLSEHFDSGSKAVSTGARQYLKELVIPDQLNKGKGKELVLNMKSYFNLRTPKFYAILPQAILTMDDAVVGLFSEPPTKADNYAAVSEELRERYAEQSQWLWDEFERQLPKDILANIRKEFKYGREERKVHCEVGDGVMALFCLLALYRPAGAAYREGIKDKMQAAAGKFGDGASPAQHIKETQKILQEALDLGVPLQWGRCGKPIVTVLTERNNTFSRALADFADMANIVDVEDAGVEINRMFSAICQACVDLEEAGLSTKRAAYVGAGWSDQAGRDGKRECWYGKDCRRSECSFDHPNKDQNAKGKGKGSGKGKGAGKGAGKGKGKGNGKGAGIQLNPDKLCKAKDCQASGRGHPFCTTHHRQLIQEGKIECKDGSVQDYVKRAAEEGKRAAQVEAQDGVKAEEEEQPFEFQPWAGQEDQRACMAWQQDQDSGFPVINASYLEWKQQITIEREDRRLLRDQAREFDQEMEHDRCAQDQDRSGVKRELNMMETFYLPEQPYEQLSGDGCGQEMDVVCHSN